MTLHEVIHNILLNSFDSISAEEIAKRINSNKLYIRKDGKDVSATQISTRVKTNLELFTIQHNLISLKNIDKGEQQNELTKNILLQLAKELIKNTNFTNNDLFSLVVGVFKHIDKQRTNSSSTHTGLTLNERIRKQILSEVPNFNGFSSLSVKGYDFFNQLAFNLDRIEDRFEFLYNCFFWIEEFGFNQNARPFPSLVGRLIAKMNVTKDKTSLIVNADQLPIHILPMLKANAQLTNHVSFAGTFNQDEMRICAKMLSNLNYKISKNREEENLNSAINELGIYIPVWNSKNPGGDWPNEFRCIERQLYHTPELADKTIVQHESKAALVIPDGLLSMSGKALKARETLTKLKHVEAIISIPMKSKATAIDSFSMVIFDFTKAFEEVYIADFNNMEGFDSEISWNTIADYYNDKIVDNSSQIQVSKYLNNEEIARLDYSWTPGRYLVQNDDLSEIKDIVTLKDALHATQRGKTVKKDMLYPGGEVKYIRTSELDTNEIRLNLAEDGMGIDADQIEKSDKIGTDGVLISLIGSALKPNAIHEEKVLFDHNILLLECKKDLLLKNYLASELKQEYVEKQIYRKSTGIPSISRQEVLNLKIKIPSLEKQREIIDERALIRANKVQLNSPSSHGEMKDFIGVLKHTLGNHIGTLSNDIDSIENYLKTKALDGALSLSELTFNTDHLKDGVAMEPYIQSQIGNTIARAKKTLLKAEADIQKSEKLLKVSTMDIKRELLSFNNLVMPLKEQFKDIQINVTGKAKNEDIYIDKYLMEVLIHNLTDNAIKHGYDAEFKDSKIMRFKCEISKNMEGEKRLEIEYMNNGEGVSDDFTTEHLIRNGVTTNINSGQGFGGSLIGKIIQRHHGEIILTPAQEIINTKFKFRIKFYLPTPIS